MKKTLRILLFLILCLFVQTQNLLYAQQYPVRVTPVVLAPYSLKLSDYATTTQQKLQVQILMTDLMQPAHQAGLKFSLEAGLNAQSFARSNDFVVGLPPFNLYPGTPVTLSNIDLRPLFELQNLNGISALQYSKALPEGAYQFCFQAFDFYTKNNLSAKSCATVYLTQYDPPQLSLPQRAEKIQANNNTPIIFQWLPRQVAPNTQYTFILKELWDLGQSPEAGFLASRTLWQETSFAPMVYYGLDKPQLIPGKRYAWQVQAKSGAMFDTAPNNDNGVYKNNGLSEIFYFDYVENCLTPTFLMAKNVGRARVELSWTSSGQNNGLYRIQYRKKNSQTQWQTAESYQTRYTITGLEDHTEYEYRIGSVCGQLATAGDYFDNNFANNESAGNAYAFSGIQYFTTDSKDAQNTNYQCGVMPNIEISNKNLLQAVLGTNETFTAGDFPVTIIDAQGSNGIYSGTGYVQVPYLADTKIKVVFNNIQLNTDRQLISGVVETSYDIEEANVVEVSIGDLIKNIIGSYKNLADGQYKSKTNEEKEDIVKNNNTSIDDITNNIDSLVNNGTLNDVEAQEFKKQLTNAKQCFEEGIYCTGNENIDEEYSKGGPSMYYKPHDNCEDQTKSCEKRINEILDKISLINEKSKISNGLLTQSVLIENLSSEDSKKGFKLYFSPAGEIVILTAKAIPSFSKELENPNVKDLHIPDGALTGFWLENEFYAGLYEKKGEKWYFEEYRHCYSKNEEGQCTKHKTYTDINNQYGSILERIIEKDETVLATLNKKSFDDVYLTVGFSSTVINQAITAQVESLIAKNLARYGSLIKQGVKTTFVTLLLYSVWDLFAMPSTVEVIGRGVVVPSLPLDIATPVSDTFIGEIPISLPITIPHSYPKNNGICKVYVIWSVSPEGEIRTAKYGMTCTDDYENECNMRPESQCKNFTRDDKDGKKYYYNWVTRELSKEMCHIIEKSLTASYVISNDGLLPTHHYLPCFVRKDDFDKRKDRAEKWIKEQTKKFGK